MLKIRLTRKGKKGQAYFRVVVLDSTKKRESYVVDDLGSYNPHTKDAMNIDAEKAKTWMKNGAQPTETVSQYFVKLGILKKSKRTGSTPAKLKTKKKAQKES